jgi:hypothetical protein
MAPKHHPTPLSGGDRKALNKELRKSQGMTVMLGQQADDLRAKGEALIQRADDLACQSWNERMWSVGEPIDPSPTVDHAINGGYPWLQIECSRCKTRREVDLCVVAHEVTTFVHDLSTRLRCAKCKVGGKRPVATLLQLTPGPRHSASAEDRT